MKIGIAVILCVVFALVATQAWSFYGRERVLVRQLGEMRAQYESAEKNYESLQADYKYYQNPANLTKELRSRFNYRLPEEKMIIVVPPARATSTFLSQ
jgi:hypothetical protein